jgi:regulator of cell morphogenesis and NO signaling
MTIDAQKTVAELVDERGSRMQLFERLGIDFCCGGKKPLAEACAEKGLDVDSVVQTMNAFEALTQNAPQGMLDRGRKKA